jgi:hypothetical protein
MANQRDCEGCIAEENEAGDLAWVVCCDLHREQARLDFLYQTNPRQARAEDPCFPEEEA